MAEYPGFSPVFSDSAVATFAALSRRRQRQLLDRSRELARDPFLLPDYSTTDTDGREISHVLVDGFVFTYWVDHAVGQVMIIEIDDVE